MSVNWQNNDYYRALKDYEKESGTTLAERNAAANPYGSHAFGGLLVSQLLPQLIVGGVDKIAGAGLHGSGDTGSATDIDTETSVSRRLNKLTGKFTTACKSKDKDECEKLLKQYEAMSDEYPDNDEVQKAYREAKQSYTNIDSPRVCFS